MYVSNVYCSIVSYLECTVYLDHNICWKWDRATTDYRLYLRHVLERGDGYCCLVLSQELNFEQFKEKNILFMTINEIYLR